MCNEVKSELQNATVGALGSELPSKRKGMFKESEVVINESIAALGPGIVDCLESGEVKAAVDGSFDREWSSRGAGPKT
jgi:hypothetical protein